MTEENTNQETQPEEQEQSPETAAPETQDKSGEPEKPLDKMTVKELREVAVDIPGITGVHAMKKDELLSLIKEARGIVDDTPVQKDKVTKSGLSVKEIKEKIARLKEEKASALEANDVAKREVLRRRINRLKKQTRKAARA
jgi:hypothetical protein